MSGLDALPPLRDVVERHGLMAQKALGQNFLFDLNLTGKIARAAGPLEDRTVVEIGPGPADEDVERARRVAQHDRMALTHVDRRERRGELGLAGAGPEREPGRQRQDRARPTGEARL